MSGTKPVNYYQEIPSVVEIMSNVHVAMDELGLDRTVHHLVQLRASQMNGCGYCVKMHTKEAREDGETSERLDSLIVWQYVGDFSDAEEAALEWTEALTLLKPGTDYSVMRERLRMHFSEKEISILTTTIAMISMWNRFQISRH